MQDLFHLHLLWCSKCRNWAEPLCQAIRENAYCTRCSQLSRRKWENSADLAQFSVPPGETHGFCTFPGSQFLQTFYSLLLGHLKSSYLLPNPTHYQSCWSGCMGTGTLNNVTHVTRPKAWPHWWCWSSLSIPTQVKGHSSSGQVGFQLTKVSMSSGLFTTGFFAEVCYPHIASSALEVVMFLISKRSCLKAHMDMAVGQSYLSMTTSLSALLQSLFWIPCTQAGWESCGWIPIHEIPDNVVQQEPIFCCSLAVCPFTSASMHFASPFHSKTFSAMAMRNKHSEQAPKSHTEEKTQAKQNIH